MERCQFKAKLDNLCTEAKDSISTIDIIADLESTKTWLTVMVSLGYLQIAVDKIVDDDEKDD